MSSVISLIHDCSVPALIGAGVLFATFAMVVIWRSFRRSMKSSSRVLRLVAILPAAMIGSELTHLGQYFCVCAFTPLVDFDRIALRQIWSDRPRGIRLTGPSNGIPLSLIQTLAVGHIDFIEVNVRYPGLPEFSTLSGPTRYAIGRRGQVECWTDERNMLGGYNDPRALAYRANRASLLERLSGENRCLIVESGSAFAAPVEVEPVMILAEVYAGSAISGYEVSARRFVSPFVIPQMRVLAHQMRLISSSRPSAEDREFLFGRTTVRMPMPTGVPIGELRNYLYAGGNVWAAVRSVLGSAVNLSCSAFGADDFANSSLARFLESAARIAE